MKKTILWTFAVMAVLMAACSRNGNEPKETANATGQNDTATASHFTVYEGEKYSMSYPDRMKETSSFGGTVNIATEDGACRLDATYNDGGPAVAELPNYAKTYVDMMREQGLTVEDPAIDGKCLTIKYQDGEEENIHFVVMKEDAIVVAGNLNYPKDKAAEYEKYLAPVMQSIKFK